MSFMNNSANVSVKTGQTACGGYAYPYLWKINKADNDYKESWNDHRIHRAQKIEKKPEQNKIPKKNRGRKAR